MNWSNDGLAELWIARLLALSMLLQNFELWAICWKIPVQSPWHWNQLNEDDAKKRPIGYSLLHALFGPSFTLILGIQILLCVALFFEAHWLNLSLLFLTHLCIQFRFKGPLNGGSDAMTTTVLSGLWFSNLLPSDPLLKKAGIFYIAFQCTLSYWIAGWIKVKNKSWLNGEALHSFICSSPYTVPESIKRWAQNQFLCRMASWSVLLWECSFPIIWFQRAFLVPYLSLGLLFHLTNFYCFGLNRFVFAWLACYPAFLY